MMLFRFPFKPSGQCNGRFFGPGVHLCLEDCWEYAHRCDNAACAHALKRRKRRGGNSFRILIHAIEVQIQRVLGHVHGLVEAFSYRNATGKIGEVGTERAVRNGFEYCKIGYLFQDISPAFWL